MDITLSAYDAAESSYALVAAASPWKLMVYDWGNAVWDQQYTGPRNSLGARPTFSTVQNRPVAVGLRLLPASKAAMPGHLGDLNEILEQMRRYGGRIAVTTANVTYVQYLEVLSGSAALQNWTNRAEWAGRVDYTATFVCAPYVRGPSMEVLDPFTTDTRSGYTYDSGASGDLAVSGGELVPASAAANVTGIHTSVGYSYGDVRVGVTSVPGATITNYKAGVVLKRTGATTRLEVYVDDTGAASRLRIDKVVAGVRTNLASVNLAARITTGAPFRVVGYINGNVVTAEHYGGFIASAAFAASPTTTTTTTLTSTDITAFGHEVSGQCGYVWTPQATTARLDDLRVSPFAYLFNPNQAAGSILLRGTIPGDAPALGEIEVVSAGTEPYPKTSVIGFARRPARRNYLQDGSFDLGVSGTVARPWTVAAVTGVTGAATSVNYVTPGRFGNAAAEIVNPATANTGPSAAMYGPFYAGVTYTANVWVRSAAGTTATRLRLGVNGDIASSAAVALSSTWTLKTVTWTPTATRLVAYIAVEVTAATATTWQIDAAEVYEGATAPTITTQTIGRGGRPPHAFLSPDEAHTLTAFAVTSVAASWPYVLGSTLRATAGSVATARWRIDPSLLDPSVHTGTVEMEVWAWIDAPNTTFTSGVVTVGLGGGNLSSVTYTREYGSAGMSISSAFNRLERLGTVAVPVSENAQVDLILQFTNAGISGNLDVPFVILVPPHRRVQTGLSPGLMPNAAPFNPAAVQIRPDGLVRARTYIEPGWSAAPGIGQTVTIDPGGCELVYAFHGTIAGVVAEPELNLLRVTPTPQWHHLRDA